MFLVWVNIRSGVLRGKRIWVLVQQCSCDLPQRIWTEKPSSLFLPAGVVLAPKTAKQYCRCLTFQCSCQLGFLFSIFFQKALWKATCFYTYKLLAANVRLLTTLCQCLFKQLFVKRQSVCFPIASVEKQSFPSLGSWLIKQRRVIWFPFRRHDLHSS